MKRPRCGARLPPRQSDIIIRPDGSVSVSFLWDDLAGLAKCVRPAPVPAVVTNRKKSKAAAGFPRKLESPYRRCAMCPAVCGFDRTVSDHPRCGGTGLRVATWGISLGDEPALSACGGSGVMMLSGCPLRCPSCHNPEMVEGGGDTGAGRFMEMAWSLLEQGAGNLQILSPTVHMPKLRHLLAGLRSEGYGIPVVLKSSGYESVAMLRQLEGLVDVYVPDFKYGRRSRRAAAAGAADYYERAREAIGEMFRQTGKAGYSPKGMIVRGVMVRHVRAPMPVSERESIRKFLDGVPEGVAVSTSDTFDILDA